MKVFRQYINSLVYLCVVCLSACVSTQSANTERILSLIEEADHYYEVGLLSTAESKYRHILRLQPSYQGAWLKLGNIYVRSDQLEAAIIAYQSCVAQEQEDLRCWNNLALARMKQAVSTLQKGKSNFTEGSSEYRELEGFQRRVIEILSNN